MGEVEVTVEVQLLITTPQPADQMTANSSTAHPQMMAWTLVNGLIFLKGEEEAPEFLSRSPDKFRRRRRFHSSFLIQLIQSCNPACACSSKNDLTV